MVITAKISTFYRRRKLTAATANAESIASNAVAAKAATASECIEMNIIEWHTRDDLAGDPESDLEGVSESSSTETAYTIRCFGVTSTGKSICCKITGFNPFYYVKVPKTFSKESKRHFIDFMKTSYMLKGIEGSLLEEKCLIVEKKDLYGFKMGQTFRFIKLVFNSVKALGKSKYIFKNPVMIKGVNTKLMKYKLYESDFEPFMRYCHLKNIQMAGWIALPKNKTRETYSESRTQMEVEINYRDVVPMNDKKEIGNFLQASWDIETYSYDGSFPDPTKETLKGVFPNVIYQIATTFKYYKDSKMAVKHLLTLKRCSPIESNSDSPTIVEECVNEQQLLIRWVDIISKMDPDIMYTYNGDTFDCGYLYERAKLLGIEEYVLSGLSRLKSVPTVQKKELFSSSAYGDSDFHRFYIPGRLNYDLLIHYKRGMKKYSSYKLDYIAQEILNEGKHDVTAKDIFKHFESGDPAKIKVIGEYCIQDTELLQRLVDKQLILLTIIQLSNVTFVPVGFSTTRGQTIKVFSQLLRKARQMGFLVPHTNFNEDTFAITVTTRKEHLLDLEDLGNYIQIKCFLNTNPFSGKPITVHGKISEIVNESTFIILNSIELTEPEKCTAMFFYKNKRYSQVSMFNDDGETDTSFTGATVLDAKPGTYGENIAVLDFASLYPTIMISRNLCFSTFIKHPDMLPQCQDTGLFTEKGIQYERFKWDDKIEYTLKHRCEGIGKSGKGKGLVCGKQAFFDVPVTQESEFLCREIKKLEQEHSENLENKILKTKVRTKKREYNTFLEKYQHPDLPNVSRFFCRVHDPIKRLPEERFQKRDVQFDFVVVQPHTETDPETGALVTKNKGVLPALLEELYTERKSVKAQMQKASKDGDKLLEDILNSTQLAIKVSLNSCYGFLGRSRGSLILKELGSIVTAVGRTLIQQSKEYAENEFINDIHQNRLLTQTMEYHPYKDLDELEKDIILDTFLEHLF